jgi:hypothetical protein
VREQREVASRIRCEIVKVYRDQGVSGAKGRDKPNAFPRPLRRQRLFTLCTPSGKSLL